jgi:hypothetical protein
VNSSMEHVILRVCVCVCVLTVEGVGWVVADRSLLCLCEVPPLSLPARGSRESSSLARCMQRREPRGVPRPSACMCYWSPPHNEWTNCQNRHTALGQQWRGDVVVLEGVLNAVNPADMATALFLLTSLRRYMWRPIIVVCVGGRALSPRREQYHIGRERPSRCACAHTRSLEGCLRTAGKIRRISHKFTVLRGKFYACYVRSTCV